MGFSSMSAIAHIGKGENSPSIATVTKLLSALGKRLHIDDMI